MGKKVPMGDIPRKWSERDHPTVLAELMFMKTAYSPRTKSLIPVPYFACVCFVAENESKLYSRSPECGPVQLGK